MGNIQNFYASQYQNTKIWKQITQRNHYFIIKNTITHEQLEKYITGVNFNQVNSQLQIYRSRIENDDKYSVKCINIFKSKQEIFCQADQLIIVLTQRIHRFCDITRFEKRIYHIFKDTLKAYRYLISKYGKFELNLDQIGFNKDHEVKAWINSNFALNFIETRQSYDFLQEYEILRLHNLFCTKSFDPNFHKLLQNIQKPLTFEKIINFLESKDSSKISLLKPKSMQKKSIIHYSQNSHIIIESPKFLRNKFSMPVIQSPPPKKLTPAVNNIIWYSNIQNNNSSFLSKAITKSWTNDRSKSKIQNEDIQKKFPQRQYYSNQNINIDTPNIKNKYQMNKSYRIIQEENKQSVINLSKQQLNLKQYNQSKKNQNTEKQIRNPLKIVRVDSITLVQKQSDVQSDKSMEEPNKMRVMQSIIIRGLDQSNKK